MTKEKEIIDYAKDYLFKNNFVLVFNLVALLSIILGLLNYFDISINNVFLNQFIYLFGPYLWFFLGICFIISGVLAFYEKYNLMFLPVFIWLLFTTAVVRTSNMPLLKNAATGDWELGPDLDPYLFLRNAYEIVEGRNLGELDEMRYAPLGAPNFIYSNLIPWGIVFVYHTINLFGNFSVTYAAIIAPVIYFTISIIPFFLFIYYLFLFKFSKEKALTGALIASFLYSFIPTMLHRTIAGIPESESLGMLFFWPSFLFFVLAWRSEKLNKQIIYGILAGLSTGLMDWTWGGYRYIYMTLGLTLLFCFLFGIEKKKQFSVYGPFLITALFIGSLDSFNPLGLISSITDTGFNIAVFGLIIFNYFLFNTKLKEKLRLNKINLPQSLITIIISVLIIFLGLLIFNPSFLFDVFSRIIEGLLYPFGRGRIGLTVAENRAPYFTEVFASFGYLFWLFFFGVVLLFYEAIKHFNLKEKIILNITFFIFLTSFIFSRISAQHYLNGDNFVSQFLYIGGLVFFGIVLIFIYINAHLKKNKKTLQDFTRIGFSYFLLISFSFWAIVSMRGAVRLFFIIGPILAIVSSYLVLKLYGYLKVKDKALKIIVISLFVLVLLVGFNVFVNYSHSTIQSAKHVGPSPYHQQWEKAMHWVETNTPEGSIFTHWWDYGYWVQTLGKRPTVSDGGHFIAWWDHTIGRYLLTTPYPETALSLMKTHNVSYLLIDSTDIGKYSAFSSIGSDETGKDRLSWIPVIVSDQREIQETASGITRTYQAGTYTDSDISYNDNGTDIYLFAERAIFAGIILKYSENGTEVSFQQPKGVYFQNNKRYEIPLRYIYYNDMLLDFNQGLDYLVYIIPRIIQSGQGIQVDNLGAMIYLTEKTKNSLLADLYLLDDTFGKYPTIKVAHVQDDYIVEVLKIQGLDLGHFVHFQGLRGPIKIWEINYPENILIRKEFLYQPEGWNQVDGPWAVLDNLEFVDNELVYDIYQDKKDSEVIEIDLNEMNFEELFE